MDAALKRKVESQKRCSYASAKKNWSSSGIERFRFLEIGGREAQVARSNSKRVRKNIRADVRRLPQNGVPQNGQSVNEVRQAVRTNVERAAPL
jgi:hypothetical protein